MNALKVTETDGVLRADAPRSLEVLGWYIKAARWPEGEPPDEKCEVHVGAGTQFDAQRFANTLFDGGVQGSTILGLMGSRRGEAYAIEIGCLEAGQDFSPLLLWRSPA